jgi:hypothetical protein
MVLGLYGLTPEQKSILYENELCLRAALGQLAKALKELQNVHDHWEGSAKGIATIITIKDDIIPTLSGLAGIEKITVEKLEEWHNILEQLLKFNFRQEYAKMAGPSNI